MSRRPVLSAATQAGSRRGFTLLEVLLALALASLVVGALTMAIDFQLRAVDTSRTDVEEAQLARVLLHHIADDLRGVVPYRPIDYDKLMSSGGSSGESGAEGEEAADEGAGQTDDSDPEDAEDSGLNATNETAEPGEPQSVPGVYGGADWIQVDVARLPRLEQFESMLQPTEDYGPSGPVSDVKTVAYYVVSPEEAGADYWSDGTEPSGGLVRRESDRAASSWASDVGLLEETETDVPPIAPEVVAIEFLYFDGTEWIDSWDSGESGTLPKAVEITITLRPIQSGSARASSRETLSEDVLEEEDLLTYRLMVHLPGAEAFSGGAASGETGETSGTTGFE